jgi:hypothetical protein
MLLIAPEWRRREISHADQRRGLAPNGEFIVPDQADATCPVLSQKIFRLTRRANHFYNSRRPVPKEGRCATSSTREGMRWTRLRRETNGAACGRRSRVVLTPRRWRQVSWLAMSALTGPTRRLPRSDGGKKARSPGRARYKPLKPSACGNAG